MKVQRKEKRTMKVTNKVTKETIEEMWRKAKMYNELSFHYSNIADLYTKLAQRMEDEND